MRNSALSRFVTRAPDFKPKSMSVSGYLYILSSTSVFPVYLSGNACYAMSQKYWYYWNTHL